MDNNDPKRFSHQEIKIGERGSLVKGIPKDVILRQVWTPFMHLDTILDEVYNKKQANLHCLSVTILIAYKLTFMEKVIIFLVK